MAKREKEKSGWDGIDRRGVGRRQEGGPASERDKERSVGRRESDVLEAVAPLKSEVPLGTKFEKTEHRQTLRKRLFEIIDSEHSKDLSSRLFDIFLISIITLNVLAVILESVQSIYQSYFTVFYWFELISVVIFTVEFVLRMWTAVEHPNLKYRHPLWGRIGYLSSPMTLIDLLVILPFYLSFIFTVDLRFMRVLRLLRIFKLTRYSSAMTIMLAVFKQEAKAFGAALFILLLIIVFSASMVFLFEHEAQPEVFSNIPNAMWWAVVTLTTVGYGDTYPITAGGKLFGAFISVVGVGMVALPAGILASSFSEQLHLRREKYKDKVADAFADGMLTENEAEQLRNLRENLGISVEEARNILQNAVRGDNINVTHCPHCGKELNNRT